MSYESIRMHCVACAHTSNNISSHWLTSGPIQTTWYITPWGHYDIKEMIWTEIVRYEGVTCLSDVTS